jgi:hypothetical protein
LHALRPRHSHVLPATLAPSDSFTVPPFPEDRPPRAARISVDESAADSPIFKSIQKDATELSDQARKAAKEHERTDKEGSQRGSQTQKGSHGCHPRYLAHPSVRFSALETEAESTS